MAGDANWNNGIKRWYFAGSKADSAQVQTIDNGAIDLNELGYEAAYPALQALDWPDVPTTGFGDLR